MENPILIYTNNITPRLDYICKFIFRDVLQLPFVFTSSILKIENNKDYFINYSNTTFNNCLQITPHPLLQESSIEKQNIEISIWNELPIFFQTNDSNIPFDIFAASFYLLSRYEEYLPSNLDEYGRFAHTSSIAFQNNFLQLPLIDVWCKQFYTVLKSKIALLPTIKNKFQVINTYDVDIAYSYKQKGFVRNVGGFFKDLINNNWKALQNRISVLLNFSIDPFDTFDEIINKQKNNKNVIWFFLMANKNAKFDKNILPYKVAMQKLICTISKLFTIGIHPSYQSNENENLVFIEKNLLHKISNQNILNSRQHYIKFSLPTTYQLLIKNNILNDYSMGYGSINGFRASTCTAFKWFNVVENAVENLQIFPFCWMDANCVYEQKMKPLEALENWNYYYDICKNNKGVFIDIWHNFIIGNSNKNTSWKNIWIQTINKCLQTI